MTETGSVIAKNISFMVLPEQNDGVVFIYSPWAHIKMSVKLDLIGQSDTDSVRRDYAELIIFGDSASPSLFQVLPV